MPKTENRAPQTLPRRYLRPRPVKGAWTIEDLRAHLQYAVDIEMWTIPFYMSAMYAVIDPASEAVELIRSVVNQEMLHVQLAANVANAYGCALSFAPPVYGQGVPHLEFSPSSVARFHPYSSNIGPLDAARLNAMCLIEYPDSGPVDGAPTATEYQSIGEFYRAVLVGARQLAAQIEGGRRQVDLFSNFYPGLSTLTVTTSGEAGFPQVSLLLHTIMAQGEGVSRDAYRPTTRDALVAEFVPDRMQNRADDPRPAASHFEKFVYLQGEPLPPVWPAQSVTPEGAAAQAQLQRVFGSFCAELQRLFGGVREPNFGPLMFQVGGLIRLCWQRGVTPTFS